MEITRHEKVEESFTTSGLSREHLEVIAALTGPEVPGGTKYGRKLEELYNTAVGAVGVTRSGRSHSNRIFIHPPTIYFKDPS